MNEVKTFILELDNKEKELKKNTSDVQSIVIEINNLIENYLKKKELPKYEKEALETLKQSYSSNLELSKKRNEIENKKKLIEENLKAKYLGYEIIDKSLNFKTVSEYEVLYEPILNEIEEECKQLNNIYELNSKFNQTNKDLLDYYLKDLQKIREKIKTIQKSNMSFDTMKLNKIKTDIDLIKKEKEKINQKLENLKRYCKNQKK